MKFNNFTKSLPVYNENYDKCVFSNLDSARYYTCTFENIWIMFSIPVLYILVRGKVFIETEQIICYWQK